MQRITKKKDPLLDFSANDPDNIEDILPFPYSMIVEVLNETILHKLSLQMHHIEQKKKNDNYEGGVKEYLGQNTIDVERISCVSHPAKTHNHLLAGDKSGTVYLLDLAKKTVFSKKQVAQSKRVTHIVDSVISDGDSSLTTIAVIQQNHHIISILRYKQSQPKLYLTQQIQIAPNQSDPNLLPFSCQFFDFCRLLVVKTFNGNILGFRIPQVTLQIQKHTKSEPIPLQQQQIKKILKYPLNMVTFQKPTVKLTEKNFQLQFKGQKVAPKSKDIKARLMNRKKAAPPVQQAGKKDPKKKQQKKPEPEEEKKADQIQFNNKLQPIQPDIVNGMDQSCCYPLPSFQPFFFILNDSVPLQKSKYFQKSKTVPLLRTVVYGWTNTKHFYIATINQPNLNQLPQYLYLTYHHQKMSEARQKSLKQYFSSPIQMRNSVTLQNVHPITVAQLSQPDQSLIAFGLKDGTVSVWNPITQNLQFNTDKHSGKVTCLRFFQKWKLISGSNCGEVFIHNVVQRNIEMKRTNTFEPKQKIPITGIEVSEIGIAMALDVDGNLRVYDLWRNQKIAKVNACNSYAMLEGKGRKWFSNHMAKNSNTIYANRDFTILLSANWPNLPARIEDRTPQQASNLQLITKNPWKTKGTNLHVIRNFQFLLSLFQGLESVYKKGYERKKIQNLFTNLQFAQLYDRTFQIPDFSRPQGGDLKKSQSNTKSLFSSNVHRSSQKSLKTSRSKDKSLKTSQKTKEVKLTNQVLHPQKFLLQRRKINKDLMVTSEGLLDWIRQQHGRKQIRQNKLISDPSKSIF